MRCDQGLHLGVHLVRGWVLQRRQLLPLQRLLEGGVLQQRLVLRVPWLARARARRGVLLLC